VTRSKRKIIFRVFPIKMYAYRFKSAMFENGDPIDHQDNKGIQQGPTNNKNPIFHQHEKVVQYHIGTPGDQDNDTIIYSATGVGIFRKSTSSIAY
jgi:hypothetical protein